MSTLEGTWGVYFSDFPGQLQDPPEPEFPKAGEETAGETQGRALYGPMPVKTETFGEL